MGLAAHNYRRKMLRDREQSGRDGARVEDIERPDPGHFETLVGGSLLPNLVEIPEGTNEPLIDIVTQAPAIEPIAGIDPGVATDAVVDDVQPEPPAEADVFSGMTKRQLQDYAEVTFGVQLDRMTSKADHIMRIRQLAGERTA